MAKAARCFITFAMTILIGLAAAQEPAQPRHWAEGRWEPEGAEGPGRLVITRAADGKFEVINTVKSDHWNDPRSLGLATIEVAGDKITIENDLGTIIKLERVGTDQLSGTFFQLRYQTHNIKTHPVTYVRVE